MRRLRTIVALVLLSLAVTPVPADAYFWAWLDDWSGPRFMGTELEWRVWCQSDQPAQSRALLLSLRRRVQAERAKYDDFAKKVNPSDASVQEFRLASRYAYVADRFLERALYPPGKATDNQVNVWAVRAVAWRALAAGQFKWAKDMFEGKTPDPAKKPEQPPTPDDSAYELSDGPDSGFTTLLEQRMVNVAGVVNLGLAVSACNSTSLQRDRQFVNLKFGWAFDAKDRNEVYDHRMVTLGASYHIVVTPFLTVGSGAGVATLTSNVREPFYKVYVEPTIVDFRPGTIGRNGRSRGPWWHVFFIRYSTLVVPTGFEPGSFGGQTERYSAELTHNVGLHADLSPVIRKLQGRW